MITGNRIFQNVLLFVAIALLSAGVTGCTALSPDIPVSKGFELEEVKWYAIRASAAYDTPENIRKDFPATVRIQTVPGTDVQYFIEMYPDEKMQVLSIRGTQNMKNAREDAEFWQHSDEKLGVYIHKGFDQTARMIYADVLPHLQKDYRTRVTGHSLGAALGTVILMYLHVDGYELDPSINFGQPKVTNRKGVKRYDPLINVTRVVDENDLVPLVPPLELVDSIHGVYEHLGDEIILLDGEYYVYLDKHDARRKSVGNFWRNIGHLSIEEHFMVNYLKNIESKATNAIQVPYREREKYIPKHSHRD